jgi:hypothetical protein
MDLEICKNSVGLSFFVISISGKLCSGGILETSPFPLDQIKVFVALVLTHYESRMQIFRGRFSARFVKDFNFENN